MAVEAKAGLEAAVGVVGSGLLDGEGVAGRGRGGTGGTAAEVERFGLDLRPKFFNLERDGDFFRDVFEVGLKGEAKRVFSVETVLFEEGEEEDGFEEVGWMLAGGRREEGSAAFSFPLLPPSDSF